MERPSYSLLRRAFTLVELLVVIAIIGVLVALLLPAVQQAREAARRMSCTNNLKQIGIALHNHHDVKLNFPPGGMQTGANGTPCYTTWTIEILPFMEQQAIYQQYRQDLLNTDAINYAIIGQQRMVPYECPSDPVRFKLEPPASGPDTSRPWRHGSYRAVSGICGNPLSYGAWDTFEPQLWPNNAFDRAWRGVLHATSSAYNGVTAQIVTANGGSTSQLGGPERMQNITDGTSNTLMAGENTFIDVTRRGTFWAYSYASYNQSSWNKPASSGSSLGSSSGDKSWGGSSGDSWADRAGSAQSTGSDRFSNWGRSGGGGWVWAATPARACAPRRTAGRDPIPPCPRTAR
jgi:prepilin-type N-terminal cleavage/methylation domain-containing protein